MLQLNHRKEVKAVECDWLDLIEKVTAIVANLVVAWKTIRDELKR